MYSTNILWVSTSYIYIPINIECIINLDYIVGLKKIFLHKFWIMIVAVYWSGRECCRLVISGKST